MCNHLKSRGWKQNVIQSRFNLPGSQCIPVAVRVHHHPPPCADLDKTWTSALRCSSLAPGDTRHIPPWSLSKINQCVSFRMSHVSDMRVQVTSYHHAASGRCSVYHFVSPVVQFICRPAAMWWRIELNQQEVKRRYKTNGSSPPLYDSLWRGHITDLPGFADVQFDCNNETCMSICSSSHPIVPLKKSVSSQHTVSHRRHVGCLKSEQDLSLHPCRVLAVSGL